MNTAFEVDHVYSDIFKIENGLKEFNEKFKERSKDIIKIIRYKKNFDQDEALQVVDRDLLADLAKAIDKFDSILKAHSQNIKYYVAESQRHKSEMELNLKDALTGIFEEIKKSNPKVRYEFKKDKFSGVHFKVSFKTGAFSSEDLVYGYIHITRFKDKDIGLNFCKVNIFPDFQKILLEKLTTNKIGYKEDSGFRL